MSLLDRIYSLAREGSDTANCQAMYLLGHIVSDTSENVLYEIFCRDADVRHEIHPMTICIEALSKHQTATAIQKLILIMARSDAFYFQNYVYSGFRRAMNPKVAAWVYDYVQNQVGIRQIGHPEIELLLLINREVPGLLNDGDILSILEFFQFYLIDDLAMTIIDRRLYDAIPVLLDSTLKCTQGNFFQTIVAYLETALVLLESFLLENPNTGRFDSEIAELAHFYSDKHEFHRRALDVTLQKTPLPCFKKKVAVFNPQFSANCQSHLPDPDSKSQVKEEDWQDPRDKLSRQEVLQIVRENPSQDYNYYFRRLASFNHSDDIDFFYTYLPVWDCNHLNALAALALLNLDGKRFHAEVLELFLQKQFLYEFEIARLLKPWLNTY